MKEISGWQYLEARNHYYSLLLEFPLEVQQQFPTFSRFISPANWSMIKDDEVHYGDYIDLSITGEQRMEMLASPNAATLLRAYAARKE